MLIFLTNNTHSLQFDKSENWKWNYLLAFLFPTIGKGIFHSHYRPVPKNWEFGNEICQSPKIIPAHPWTIFISTLMLTAQTLEKDWNTQLVPTLRVSDFLTHLENDQFKLTSKK